MEDLFDITKQEYAFERKVRKLREKIYNRLTELSIKPEHTDKEHFYRFDNQVYPSVSHYIKILKDPSLATYNMNRALQYSQQHWKEFTEDNILYHIGTERGKQSEAQKYAESDFKSAGTIGTIVHNWREEWFKKIIEKGHDINNEPAYDPMAIPEVKSACRGITRFVREHNYQPVACELYVADHKLGTGGQVDDIGFVDGELALVDLKTSNIGDKEAYFAQVALYLYMFQKLYKIRPKKLYILHASKQTGTYNLIPIRNIPSTIKWALKVVEVSRGLDQIKEGKKKKVINI